MILAVRETPPQSRASICTNSKPLSALNLPVEDGFVTNSFKRLMYSMLSAIRRLLAAASLSLLFITATAQGNNESPSATNEAKPYKVYTSGKQVTIKSTKAIKHVMVWTTGGNRVIEQKEINNNSYTFTIPVNQKTFFLMIGLDGGKIYTEKMGIQ
jgi:hypothetical protein